MIGRCVAVLLACLVATGSARAQEPRSRPERIAALEWSVASMLASLGVVPVGVADADLYRIWVGRPDLPTGVPDIGLRTEPNLEILAGLKPDLILASPLSAAARPILERIAPVREIAIYTEGGRPLEAAARQLTALGTILGRTAEAAAVIGHADLVFASHRAALAGHAVPPLLAVQFLDARHVRVYGPGGLFDAVMKRLGLRDAWSGGGGDWGYTLVGIEQLAAYPEATLVVVDPVPPGVTLDRPEASLWASLPAVRAGRVVRIPPVWAFGDLVAAERFADVLVPKLLARPEAHAAR